jgi:replicative superfamily II helicase
MGVNTPAAAVAIVGLTHPWPVTPYTVAEYKNMVGRAGRLGFNERGESYLIPEGDLDASRAWSDYVNGALEPLRSQLVPDGDPRSLILRVFASYPAEVTGLVTRENIISFLDSSFAAFQAREGGSAQWDVTALERHFDELVRAKLIEADADGYRLTDLGRFAGESGVHVDSIVRLVFGLRGAADLNAAALITAAQLTNELADIFMPAAPKAKNTEVPRWPSLLLQQQVPESLVRAIQSSAPDLAEAVRRSKRAAAAIMWIAGLPIEEIERELLRHMPRSSGASGTVRTSAERTRDLLPAVGAVLRELDPGQDYSRLLERTMVRIELGIPAEICDLVMMSGAVLSRTAWLALAHAGITSVEAVRDAAVEQLATILGSDDAAQALRRACDTAASRADEASITLPVPTE